MEKKNYTAVFNDETEIEISNEDLDNLDIVEILENRYHALYKSESYRIELINVDYSAKIFSFKINNSIHELALKDNLDILVSKMGLSKIKGGHFNEVKSPMPGLVLEICVEKGQEVQANDKLMVVEAMKMENLIKAHGQGKVKRILVAQGDKVDNNQLLIEIE